MGSLLMVSLAVFVPQDTASFRGSRGLSVPQKCTYEISSRIAEFVEESGISRESERILVEIVLDLRECRVVYPS